MMMSSAVQRYFIFGISLLLSSCITGVGKYGYDNPKLRALQHEQSARYLPGAKNQTHFVRKIGPRVYPIKSGNQSGKLQTAEEVIGGGRGAAITADGYFLTAYHVIEGPAFYLSEVSFSSAHKKRLKKEKIVILNERESQKHISESNRRGRIVWFDKTSDLAIVKFDQRTPNYFRVLRFPERGSTVFATDDQGSSIIPRGRSFQESVGNGPFFSAGGVLSMRPYHHHPGFQNIETSLVARGGMSGSPLVTTSGELCGILSEISLHYQLTGGGFRKTTQTSARMMPPEIIRRIIREDRKKSL